MKRLAACITILAVIAAASVFSLFSIGRANERLLGLIDETAESYRTDRESTPEKLDELEECWKDYYVKISYIAQSCTLDDISYSVAKLPALLEKDAEEFLSECESVSAWVRKVYDSQFPHLYSVF